MNNIKEIQEFNRRKIICAVHNTEDYDEALEKDIGYSLSQYYGNRNKVLPKPLTLSRVLLSLAKYPIEATYYPNPNGAKIGIFDAFDDDKDMAWWDLEKETLEQQSPEMQISIAKLLGYDKR